ncbi:cysteine desulfurase [bacterium]|nr:MAG: cysteine desulfurase [bacterium]
MNTLLTNDLDIAKVREEFPILSRQVHGKPLVFLDNGASSQMPRSVQERIRLYHSNEHANVHRGVHYLSQTATDSYEKARVTVQNFIHAKHEEEIIWTSGTTDAINTVAASLAQFYFKEGDEILLTEMEHHANIVSWQIHAVSKGVKIKVIPVLDNGELDLDAFENLLTDKVKLVSLVHISNVLGTVNPVKFVIDRAHEKGIPVLVDGAQSTPHSKIDVQHLDCDFFVFSAHKMYGPTGVGVLYGKKEWLSKMPPVRGGGDMIMEVSFEKTTYNELPYKFEAGTPNISGAIGLGAAIEFIQSIGLEKMAAHEHDLLVYATSIIEPMQGISILGTAKEKASIISLIMDEIHPHDVGTILDMEGIAVRAGHHCAQPLMTRFGIPATSRASFAVYNTKEEIDALVQGLLKVQQIFA